jgi:hypothetical protein
MNGGIEWDCPSCQTKLRAEAGGEGCFPFPEIRCPVCSSLQNLPFGEGVCICCGTLIRQKKPGRTSNIMGEAVVVPRRNRFRNAAWRWHSIA